MVQLYRTLQDARVATGSFSRSVAAVFLLLMLGLLPGAALASGDFFRSSPGELSSSHAAIDGQDHCNDCHAGGREVNDNKCLGCHEHKKLNERIRAGKGFHASRRVSGKKCASCHIEHKGRGYDMIGWRSVGGTEKFDHKLTDWPLRGKHGSVGCKDCHKRKNAAGTRLFLGENTSCNACHKRSDPHGFNNKTLLACERCHTESVWKPVKRRMSFDHNDSRDAAMALEGAHEDVGCLKCHPQYKFSRGDKKPGACGSCHASPHEGHLFGKSDCDTCHSSKVKSLKTVRFNHAKRARFELAGAHGKEKCYACHTKKLGTSKPEPACAGCHGDKDPHKTRFDQFGRPSQCEVCHPSTSWQPRVFNHDARTRFVLAGKHEAVKCRGCHRGKNPADFEQFDPRTVGCMGCHAHKKVHDGKFKDKQCLECHKAAGKREISADSVGVYHGAESQFPLVHGHAGVECARCHINNVYEQTPMECGVQCHEDSLHQGSLGEECSRCHETGIWDATRFTHKEDTKWPLKGLHASTAKCRDCHPARQYKGTPTACGAAGCHKDDDVHEGKLGEDCGKCHLETGAMVFEHNTMSMFALENRHLQVKCSECHPKISFKPRPTTCFGCHGEPAAHKGQYGTVCENCHNTQGWLDIKATHDAGEFALVGAHDNVACVRCHKDNRPLGGSGNLCINCHRRDDIHGNALSPRCGECHTQWSFAPARFDHSTVGCYLTGLHRTLPCAECHRAGNYNALADDCASCHRDTAVRVRNVQPDHAGIAGCAGCHNPNAWKPAAPAYGRNSICR